MTKAGKGAVSMVNRDDDVSKAGMAAQAAGRQAAEDDARNSDGRKRDRRRSQSKLDGVERRRSARRYSDRIAASFTSAFVAQWLGQETSGGEPGDELALRRSASLVYAAVQEHESQYFRALGRNAKKTQDYS